MLLRICRSLGLQVTSSWPACSTGFLPSRVVGTIWRNYSHQEPEDKMELGSVIPPERVRNFSIVAHVDHGKSTLADRMLEMTGVIDKKASNKQVLDRLPVERERGITVKAQTATMFYNYQGQQHMLNLIDTPGHVDFSYEVSRSLAACQGVLLLVDAQQGVQAQTVANFLLASEGDLSIIPVINKIDLGLADVPAVIEQLGNAFGFVEEEIMKVSAKHGTQVEELFPAVIQRLKCPPGDPNAPLKMLLFDSWYDQYRGVICVVAITEGSVRKGDEIKSSHTGNSYEVNDLGILQTKQIPQTRLFCGQVGYVVMGIRSVHDAHIGDTFHHVHSPVTPLQGFKPAKPMVFAGFYPMDSGDYPTLRMAVDKLTLNDSSVMVFPDSSVALGQGWRLGFLGLLHMDVFRQRLEEEHDASVIITSPNVPYKAVDNSGKEIQIINPSQFPDPATASHMDLLEPMVLGTLIFPDTYLGKLLKLCEDRRGVQKELLYLDQKRVMLKYLLPLSEIVMDFYDQIKSLSSGYASFDYENCGNQSAPLVKLDILLNGSPVDALALIVHKEKAQKVGRRICEKLKENIHRQLFEIAIQAAIGQKIIARETVKALRKDVTAKCYGGDISRRMKLLKRQKEGKKKMKMISNVELSKKVFLSVIER